MAFFLDIEDDEGYETVEVVAAIKPEPRVVVESATHLLTSPEDWNWDQLRDYVMGQIQAIHGPQVRNPVKEKAIFQGFLNRWGSKSSSIAKFAFDISQGVWQRAPISVNRFTKNSDPFFAQVIADQLGL